MWRFLGGSGSYPHHLKLNTPIGVIGQSLYSRHDLLTVNEIFARLDYRAESSLGVAVDVGANIGIASSYFLTRNLTSRVYAIEPNPANVVRLRTTLDSYPGRFELLEVAAAEEDGTATFFVEPSGRYGGFTQGWKSEQITVPTKRFGDILEDVLSCESRIDVLKVDTEGSEQALVSSIAPEHLDRIDRIYYETVDPEPFHASQFTHHFECQTNALIRRG
jgi:FkbM family methyltransferase